MFYLFKNNNNNNRLVYKNIIFRCFIYNYNN